MSPLARSLLALAAAALLAGAGAAPPKPSDDKCNTVTHGTSNGWQIDLAPVTIRAGEQDATVNVQDFCFTRVIGEVAAACDDAAPTLFVPQLPLISPVVVHRNGNYYAQDMSVRVTLWCALD